MARSVLLHLLQTLADRTRPAPSLAVATASKRRRAAARRAAAQRAA